MKTIDRYIASLFIKNFFLAVVSLTSLFLFQALLGEFFDHAYSPQQILIYHLLDVPQRMVQMMPPSVLLATVFTLSGLNRTQELVACYSIGVGVLRIISLLLSLVLIICSGVLVLQDRILPHTYKKRTAYYWKEMKNKPDFYMDFKKDKIWYRSKNLIYNLRVFDTKANLIRGMSVYTFDENFNLIQIVDADHAEYSSSGWKLLDGTVTVFTRDHDYPMTQKFQEKFLIIPETPKDFQEIEKEVDGLRLKEIYRYIQRLKDAGANAKAVEVNFHSKISTSFIPIVMCLLAVPFSLRNRREGGFAKDLGLCLGVTFFYWLFYSIGLSLGSNGALPPWLAAWMPSFVFLVFASFLVLRKQQFS